MRKYLLPEGGNFYKANLHCHTVLSDGAMTPEEVKAAGFDAYYIDHTTGIWPQAAAGVPFTAKEFQSKGDAITDLTENLPTLFTTI